MAKKNESNGLGIPTVSKSHTSTTSIVIPEPGMRDLKTLRSGVPPGEYTWEKLNTVEELHQPN